MEMLIHNHIQCDGALSDLILQAARQAIPSNVDELIILPGQNRLNQPLLPLLVGLLDAVQATARAVDDNAWDDCAPLDLELAAELAKQCRAIATSIKNASKSPDAIDCLLPPMT